jgi:hypothetical protein
MTASTAYVNQILPKDAARVVIPGHVIQVVNSSTTSSISTTGNSFISTPLSVSITPTSSNSKFLVFGNAFVYASGSQTQPQITLYRNGSDIVNKNYGFGNMYTNSGGYGETILPFSFMDTPSTATTLVYTLYFRNNSVGTAYFGSSDRLSVITVMEIAQ